jgi:hypothetical protein
MRDDDGVEWQVYEVVLPEALRSAERPRHPLNLPASWLCFESGTQRRRLSPVPEGWQEAKPAELRRLFDLATRSGERGRQRPRA